MLRQRVATALVLLAILVPSVFLAPPWAWGLVSLTLLAIAAHEWGLLIGKSGWARSNALQAIVVGVAYVAMREGIVGAVARDLIVGTTGPGFVVTVTLAGLGLWMLAAVSSLRRHAPGGPPGYAVASMSLLACWIALYELRVVGPTTLVSCLAIVWLADIGAYFAGRAFGRRKLAPRVSPAKSWEGVAGGLVAVLATAALAAALWPGGAADPPGGPVFSSRLAAGIGWPATVLVLAALTGLSVLGDLYESLLKRLAGVKDSGTLLPGHGGVLDRIDALIPTMPGCLLLWQVLR